ncbi:hypothetical protein KC343_g9787 [Hortaea werneckii]|nr:hypothetical protein KC352_g23247 [Hortaea werneckii]KAI7560039.1 hypothetical protein KC317_g9981 [Hortaea werneckii]KAI7616383.1 hypothetical protein KC343_g9787 [Hortaea werneckii]KAI7619509.1 hypothetical protein KC346_g4527 [Hortaea werneckii]KAI7646573.1 hypothetical protein KC319_g11799 [Hortaea werneckii]
MKRKRDMIDFTGDIIHVKCGGSNKLTHVHRSLLEEWTILFDYPLDVPLIIVDPVTNTTDLSDLAHHDGFQFVVQWLYTGHVEIVGDATDPVATLHLLAHAYCAAEELDVGFKQEDFSLANGIMDQFVTRMTVPRHFGPAMTTEDFLKICRSCASYLRDFAHDWLMYGDLTSTVNPKDVVQLVIELDGSRGIRSGMRPNFDPEANFFNHPAPDRSR